MTEEVKTDCCFSYCYDYTKVSIYKKIPTRTFDTLSKRRQLDYLTEKDCLTSSLFKQLIDLRIRPRRHAVACFCFCRLILTSPTWKIYLSLIQSFWLYTSFLCFTSKPKDLFCSTGVLTQTYCQLLLLLGAIHLNSPI